MVGASISWRVPTLAIAGSCGWPSKAANLIPVTRSPVDIESFVLSRDGASLAFSAQVFPGGPDTLGSTAERLKADARRSTSGEVHDRLFVRHWDQWKTGRRRHLFVQPCGRRSGRRRHARHGCRRTEQAVRRRGAVHLHARRARHRLHRARCRSRGGMEHGSGPLRGSDRCAARRPGSSRRRTGRPTQTRRSAPTGRCWRTSRWTVPATKPTS